MDNANQEEQPYLHFSIKSRTIAWISENLFDGVTYTVRHGLLKGMRRKGGLGWAPAFVSHSVETLETEFWRNLDLSNKIVYDVGAFHGMLTLFFARQARHVVSYEPNSKNRARLEDNLKLNGIDNVTVRPKGLGASSKTMTMVYDPLMAGGARIDEKSAGPPDSGLKAEQIIITTVDEDRAAANLPPPDFIKIDIEGWELEALKGARETLMSVRPALFLEMHGNTMKEKKSKVVEIVAFLNAAGYTDIRHIESNTAVQPGSTDSAAVGHLYCPAGNGRPAITL